MGKFQRAMSSQCSLPIEDCILPWYPPLFPRGPARVKKPRPFRISFVSLGCAKNLVDSEVLLGRLVQSGGVLCADPDDAEMVVINTCAFIDSAIEESFATIREALERKRAGLVKGVVVAGCLAQRFRERVIAEVPEVDAIVGVYDREQISEVCRAVLANGRSKKPAEDACCPPTVGASLIRVSPNRAPWGPDTARLRLTPRHYAFVRISEGCSNPCTFCIIPQIRGAFRSKPPERLLEEVRELVADGAQELNLIGQDLTDYGRDLWGERRLGPILRQIGDVAGVRWVRLLYAYPAHFGRDVEEAIAEHPRIVKYLDMPIQHAADRVLARMRRGHDRKHMTDLFLRLRSRVPEMVLRTTVIVGFPGETESDVRELIDFMKEVEFDRLGAFVYSPEKGTIAERFEDQIAPEVKQERWKRVMEAQQKIAFRRAGRMVGRRVEVVVERPAGTKRRDQQAGFARTTAPAPASMEQWHHSQGELAGGTDTAPARLSKRQWEGRTAGDAPDIDSLIYLSGKDLAEGQFRMAEVIGTSGYDLIGKVVD